MLPIIKAHRHLGPAAKEFRECAAPDCRKTALARGLCTTHYNKARRDGSLPATRRPKEHLVRLKTCVSTEIDSELMKLARISGKTCSEIIRDAITKYLASPDATAAPK